MLSILIKKQPFRPFRLTAFLQDNLDKPTPER